MTVNEYIEWSIESNTCKADCTPETIIIVNGDNKYKVITDIDDIYYSDYVPDEILNKEIGEPIYSKVMNRTTIITR